MSSPTPTADAAADRPQPRRRSAEINGSSATARTIPTATFVIIDAADAKTQNTAPATSNDKVMKANADGVRLTSTVCSRSPPVSDPTGVPGASATPVKIRHGAAVSSVPSVVRYRLDVSLVSSLLVIVAVAAAIVLSGLVSAASRPLSWAFACGTVALLLSPVVAFFARRLPHWLAVVVSLLLVAVTFAGIWTGVSATLADNVDEIRTTGPAAAGDLEDRYQIAEDFQLQRRVTDFVDDLNERFGARAEIRRRRGHRTDLRGHRGSHAFPARLRPAFVAGGLAQIDDPARRERTRAVIDRTVELGRGYLLLAIAKAAAVTVIAGLAFVLVGLEASFLLGLIVGGLSIIPYLGITLGGLPALLLAAAFEGADAFWLVVVLILGLQLLDALVVQPRIDERTIHVGPALPLIVGLIGWELYGLGGAVYSVALLVLLIALARAVSTDDDGTDVVVANVAARSDDRAGGAADEPGDTVRRGFENRSARRGRGARGTASRKLLGQIQDERLRLGFGSRGDAVDARVFASNPALTSSTTPSRPIHQQSDNPVIASAC